MANFVKYSGFIRDAAREGCSMAFLPEGFDFIGSNIGTTLQQSEKINQSSLLKDLQSLAVESDIWLSLGGFHEKVDSVGDDGKERISNSHLIINSEGQICSIYRKIHLFDAPLVGLKESNWTIPGEEITENVETPAGTLAPSWGHPYVTI